MMFSGRRVISHHFWVFSPKGTRMFLLSRVHSLCVSTKKKSVLHPNEGDEPQTTENNQEEREARRLNLKRIAFAAPKLDESELIIEEIGMGEAKTQKAELGSKVTVKFQYKSEDGQDPPSKTYDLVLGDSKVMGGLHKGIIGMRLGDKRKITIPPSVHNEDESILESICEVTLLYIE